MLWEDLKQDERKKKKLLSLLTTSIPWALVQNFIISYLDSCMASWLLSLISNPPSPITNTGAMGILWKHKSSYLIPPFKPFLCLPIHPEEKPNTYVDYKTYTPPPPATPSQLCHCSALSSHASQLAFPYTPRQVPPQASTLAVPSAKSTLSDLFSHLPWLCSDFTISVRPSMTSPLTLWKAGKSIVTVTLLSIQNSQMVVKYKVRSS